MGAWIRRLRRYLQTQFRPDAAAREVDEELRFHVAMRAREHRRGGLTTSQALERAERRFGDRDKVAQRCLATRGLDRRARRPETMLARVAHDMRYAVRGLGASPGYAAITVLTLALGIGVNTAIFSVVHGVVLRPLPYGDPDRLVGVWETNGTVNGVAAASYHGWREGARVFEDLAVTQNASLVLSGDGRDPLQLRASLVSANFFRTLGVPPAIGRAFQPGDDVAGGEPVAVLSHGMWQREFGGDSSAVGTRIRLNGRSTTIVGVMPVSFETFPQTPDVWSPKVFSDTERRSLSMGYRVVGRLHREVDLAGAVDDVDRVARQLEAEFPQRGPWSVAISPLHDQIVSTVRPRLYLLFGAVAAVLLVVCANVANLMLARGTVRESEVALRMALGATRPRVTIQMLLETMVLAGVGGVVGLGLAWLATDALLALSPGGVPRLETVAIDTPVILFAAAVAVATGLLAGLVPTLRASAVRLMGVLVDGAGKTSGGRRFHRMRVALVAFESAVVVMLLIATGLLLRSFWQALQSDPGFQPQQRLAVAITLPPSRYPDSRAVEGFFDDVSRRIEAIPGVRAVGVTTSIPPAGNFWNYLYVQSRPDVPDDAVPLVDFTAVDASYFSAIGIPLIRGRLFTRAEHETRTDVAIVNETLARQQFGGEDPIGQFITFNPERGFMEIVGVVGDAKHGGLDVDVPSQVYIPNLHINLPWHTPARSMVVWTSLADPTDIAPPVREAVWSVDPRQPIARIEPLEEAVDRAVADRRFHATLLAAFGATALLLGAVGVYGVVSYASTQRTREVGIRVALGANPGDVLRLILRTGATPVLGGVVLGVGTAWMVGSALEGFLYGVGGRDPMVMGAMAALVLGVGVVAAYLPARRASSADPVRALRR